MSKQRKNQLSDNPAMAYTCRIFGDGFYYDYNKLSTVGLMAALKERDKTISNLEKAQRETKQQIKDLESKVITKKRALIFAAKVPIFLLLSPLILVCAAWEYGAWAVKSDKDGQ